MLQLSPLMNEPTYSPAAADWAIRLLQCAHRLAIAATLMLVTCVVLVLLEKPADQVALWVIFFADGAMVLAGALLLRAYRTARPMRQIIGLLLFSLVLAHVAGWMLLDQFQHIAAWRESPAMQSVLKVKSST